MGGSSKDFRDFMVHQKKTRFYSRWHRDFDRVSTRLWRDFHLSISLTSNGSCAVAFSHWWTLAAWLCACISHVESWTCECEKMTIDVCMILEAIAHTQTRAPWTYAMCIDEHVRWMIVSDRFVVCFPFWFLLCSIPCVDFHLHDRTDYSSTCSRCVLKQFSFASCYLIWT